MRIRRAVAVVFLASASTVPALAVLPAAPPAVADSPCDNVEPGQPLKSQPWPQQQLDIAGVHQVTEGRYVTGGRFDGQRLRAGDPVVVAVVDSGFDKRNPVFRSAGAKPDFALPIDYVAKPVSTDCVGHGTEVASLIYAQPDNGTYMLGMAPESELLPVLYTNSERAPNSNALIAGLSAAIDAHPRVINLSSQLTSPPVPALMAQLRRAQRDGIVIVAAAGNDDSQSKGPFYPAALSTSMSNIIAVSAVDQNGSAGSFSVRGDYVDVAAPGVDLAVANRANQGFLLGRKGTSFAAPFVTGTVALMLAAHPNLTPAQVKHRIEVTADPPPGSIPDPSYGYGTVDPLQAVTSAENDAVATPATPATGKELAAPAPPAAPDRSLQHRALAIAFVLLGLAVLTVVGAAVLRGRRRQDG